MADVSVVDRNIRRCMDGMRHQQPPQQHDETRDEKGKRDEKNGEERDEEVRSGEIRYEKDQRDETGKERDEQVRSGEMKDKRDEKKGEERDEEVRSGEMRSTEDAVDEGNGVRGDANNTLSPDTATAGSALDSGDATTTTTTTATTVTTTATSGSGDAATTSTAAGGQEAGSELSVLDGVECKFNINSYRMIFVVNTESFLYRRNSLTTARLVRASYSLLITLLILMKLLSFL